MSAHFLALYLEYGTKIAMSRALQTNSVQTPIFQSLCLTRPEGTVYPMLT